MSDNTNSTVLERYTQQRTRTPADNTYRAYGPQPAQGQQTKLKICHRDGTMALLSYGYLMEVICTSHQFLSLIYTNCVITLEGRHLTDLVEYLQDDKIRWIQCFNQAQFDEVTEEIPVVTAITRQSMQEFIGKAEE